mmetsp:Transcript_17892/g.56003  ORF Transcript_17892/g.56003 Transcript_17892/m.56003 type:complete len:224 (-) Transcript_17892:1780-2451(-)
MSVSRCWSNSKQMDLGPRGSSSLPRSRPYQSMDSLASCCSILSSLTARSTTSPTSSTNLWSWRARRWLRAKSSGKGRGISFSVMRASCIQCRSRMAGTLRSPTHGRAMEKFFMDCSSDLYTGISRRRLSWPRSALESCFVSSSMAAVSMFVHSVSSQSAMNASTTAARSHSPFSTTSSARASSSARRSPSAASVFSQISASSSTAPYSVWSSSSSVCAASQVT